MKILMDEIKFGQRLRIDYGDLQELADSIKKFGLLHPIVIDADFNLIAGGRRFLACERIGLKEIEAKVLGQITEKELRILELEENLRRKDLTSLEKSKNLLELAELKESENDKRTPTQSMNNFCPESGQKLIGNSSSDTESSKRAGRPEGAINHNSITQIAKEIGIPKQTLSDAKAHVEAVERYPDLETLPKYKAIETAKERSKLLDLAKERNKREKEGAQPILPEEPNPEYSAYLDKCHRTFNFYHDAICKVRQMNVEDSALKEFSELLDSSFIQEYIEKIDECIPKLLKIQRYLKELRT